MNQPPGSRTIRLWSTVYGWVVIVGMALSLVVGLPVATAVHGGPERLLYLLLLPWLGFMAWHARRAPFEYSVVDDLLRFRCLQGVIEIPASGVTELRFPWHSGWGTLAHGQGSISLPWGLPGTYGALTDAVRSSAPEATIVGRW